MEIKLSSAAVSEVLAVANKPSTGEGEDVDSTYFGYSSAVGDLDADGRRNDVAVGVPRGAKLNGSVGSTQLHDSQYYIMICYLLRYHLTGAHVQ